MNTEQERHDEAQAAIWLELNGLDMTCVNPECPGIENGKRFSEKFSPKQVEKLNCFCGYCSRPMLSESEVEEHDKLVASWAGKFPTHPAIASWINRNGVDHRGEIGGTL